MLAFAAYMRAVFEPVGAVITTLTIPVAGMWLVAVLFARFATNTASGRGRRLAEWLAPSALALILISLAFQVVTMPYRNYRETEVTLGRSSWVVTADIAMAKNWLPNHLYEVPDPRYPTAYFLGKGRGNTACNVEPEKCAAYYEEEIVQPGPYKIWDDVPYSADHYRSEVIRSLVTKPHRWLAHKGAIVPAYWFSSVERWPVMPRGLEVVWNGMFLIAAVGAAGAATWVLVRRNFVLGLVVLLLMGAAFGGPFIGHFEVRYFFPLKVIGWTALPLLACVIQGGRQQRNAMLAMPEEMN
jgi:hypothetical protein